MFGVFRALDACEFQQLFLGSPPADAHFDERGAEGFEVPQREVVALCFTKFRETQLDVASCDRAPPRTQAMADTTEKKTDAQAHAVWQRADEAEQTERDPGWPVLGGPETAKRKALG